METKDVLLRRFGRRWSVGRRLRRYDTPFCRCRTLPTRGDFDGVQCEPLSIQGSPRFKESNICTVLICAAFSEVLFEFDQVRRQLGDDSRPASPLLCRYLPRWSRLCSGAGYDCLMVAFYICGHTRTFRRRKVWSRGAIDRRQRPRHAQQAFGRGRLRRRVIAITGEVSSAVGWICDLSRWTDHYQERKLQKRGGIAIVATRNTAF